MDRQIPLRVQRRNKLIRAGKWLGGFLVVMAAGAWVGSRMLTAVDRKALVVSAVDRGTIEVSVTATGRIVPAFEEVITSPISSRILEVYAHSGDSVDVGTPLLRLDLLSTETELAKALDEREIRHQQMEQLRANIKTQLSDRRMQIEVEEMKLSQLQAQLRNELYLDSLGSGTRDRVRQAETTLRTAQLQLRQLRQQYDNELRVKQADLRMQQLQTGVFEKGLAEKQRTVAEAAIRAPRRATLTYITNEIGATVGAGQKVAIVSDLSHFKAECEISDTYSDRVLVGGEALLRIGKERLPATIATVTPLSQGGAITFTVQPQNPSHPRLRSGLKTEVYVITSIRDDVLRIRNGSFYAGPGKYTLFIFKDDRTLVPREVQLGECNYDYIEVISGLSEGEELVVCDMAKYKGKEKLRVRSE